MDGAELSLFPHLSWLGFAFGHSPASGTLCHVLHGTVHALNIVLRGRVTVRSLCRGLETRHERSRGSIHFLPADGEEHTLLGNASEEVAAYSLFLPRHHLDALAAEDHAPSRVECRSLLIEKDAILQHCLVRLVRPAADDGNRPGDAEDEAARRLVLRLVELSGGGKPDWRDDASMFDRRTLGHLVDHIDAHLKIAPSLSEMGMRVGLSPSHFAKKFRQSTGLSLHRFVNRRRIRASLESLRDQSHPLAHTALDLGFSSQAHFTHTFSSLTGMTPAKYRKQHRPTIG